MGGVANDCLIEISDFDFNVSLRTRDRTQIAQMTITANPYGRTYRNQIATRRLQPFIEFERVASHVGMRRASHLRSRERFKRSSLACGPEGGLYAFIADYYPVARRRRVEFLKRAKGQLRAIPESVR